MSHFTPLKIFVAGLGFICIAIAMYIAIQQATTTALVVVPAVATSEVKTYTSEKLGVQFQYLASQGDPIIEEGNRIYVGGKEGQWVQEFTKDPADDLATAVKKQFLATTSPKDCEVSVARQSSSVG